MNFRLHRRAVEESDYEVDYYESIYEGLGAELRNVVDSALDRILQSHRSEAARGSSCSRLGTVAVHGSVSDRG